MGRVSNHILAPPLRFVAPSIIPLNLSSQAAETHARRHIHNVFPRAMPHRFSRSMIPNRTAGALSVFEFPHGAGTSLNILRGHTSECLSVSPQKASPTPMSAQGFPAVSFHKRPLPESLIALSCKEGKRIFQEALLSGGAESYFPLSEQFITQSEPSFCSLTSLAMVLNALNHDPKKTWKGVWRWISEETLQCEFPADCGHTLDKVKATGMNFSEFEALAKCHEVSIASYRASRLDDKDGQCSGLENFRAIVASTSQSSSAKAFVVCNFSRPHLGQTGDGHFSPIGAYHKDRDLVLVLDVARFKYPPFWVSLRTLWEAMSELDAETGLPRGFFVISTRAAAAAPPPATQGTCTHAHSSCAK